MSNLTAGTYQAKPTGETSVYENERGNLVLCMQMNVEGECLRYYTALATEQDGINTRQVETLKQVFGWDGVDFFWFVDHPDDYTDKTVEVVIEMQPGRSDPGRVYPSIKWLNVPGGGDLPASGDRNSLLTKYGSKFRAVAGGAPPKAAAKPPAPPSNPPPSKPAAKPSDQMTVWGRFCELGGNDAQWFDVLAKAVLGVDQGDFSPEHWGTALEWIESNTIPF